MNICAHPCVHVYQFLLESSAVASGCHIAVVVALHLEVLVWFDANFVIHDLAHEFKVLDHLCDAACSLIVVCAESRCFSLDCLNPGHITYSVRVP